MMRFAADKDYDFRILDAVEAVNERQKLRLVDEDARRTSASLKGKRIAVWGLAFKPKTDDMREAPAVPLDQGTARRRRDGAGLRSGGDESRARDLRIEDSLRRQQLRRADRRRRAGDRHRVERVPASPTSRGCAS